MSKQEMIKKLTDLMGVVSNAYFKGKLGVMNGDDTGGDGACCGELWVHEASYMHSSAISVDLYNFGGDGQPVCEELNTYVYEDNRVQNWEVFVMHYDPDNERHPLTFVVDGGDKEDGDIDTFDVMPDQLPERTLTNITAWLDGVFQRLPVKLNVK